ncbi:MAG: methyltransferase domain-containing protein [Pseudomonadota bacterium]
MSDPAAWPEKRLSQCPLCGATGLTPVRTPPPRRYATCPVCHLVSLDPKQRPTAAEEKAEYDLHENDPDDPRYRKWLSRLVGPMMEGVTAPIFALDFGSGPGPTIAPMLEERGHSCRNYDPFYATDQAELETSYERIFCSETAEHFFAPATEFAQLFKMLRPGGRLGVMTQMLTPDIDFATWRYRLQPSHVVFYRPQTMAWIANAHEATLDLQLPDVAIFGR